MTRKEQIKEKMLEISTSNFTSAIDYGAYSAGYMDGVDWADAHPNWISVEDELPKVGVAVLTTTQNGTQRVGCYEDGWWLANSPDLVRMGSITHWMPLPQPPKKGGEHTKEEIKGNQGKISPNQQQIIGTEEHIKIALDVMEKGGEQ